ncbi:hypothetical protein [Streptomyces albus]|uniref:Uncharacterized protein n=1 Tax=Streptomyces albus TaxID=1888 RepID=A0A8H1L5A7_9ACTN|nr:hypothetical protein [Streptomyces albus]TGG78494.1 hypothetical protein D8771_25215 [Streptomyces albus]UVN59424.1 hypothetical protein NR995_33335 [Streptomyces albus]
MSEASASHLRTLAADAEALQQRLRDALAGLDETTPAPTVSFHLGEAFASLGTAARTLEAAAEAAARTS